MNKKISRNIKILIILTFILIVSSDLNTNIIKHSDVAENPPTIMLQVFNLSNLEYINEMSYMDSYYQIDYNANNTHSWMDIRIDVEVYDHAYNVTYINDQLFIEINPQIHNYTLIPVFERYVDNFNISEYRLKYTTIDYYADIEVEVSQFVNKMFDFTYRYIIDTPSPKIIDEEQKIQRLNSYKLLIIYHVIILIIIALITIKHIFDNSNEII